MKKILVYAFVMLSFLSCDSDDEFNQTVLDENLAVSTRTTKSNWDFNPISELDGFLVNVKNVGNTTRKYLSCESGGNDVILYNKDENNGRQQWRLYKGRELVIERGNKNVSASADLMLGADNWDTMLGTGKVPTSVKLYSISKSAGGIPGAQPLRPSLAINALENGLCTIATTDKNINNPMNFYYLQSSSSTGSSLNFTTVLNSNLAKWQIEPLGEYELVDLEYVRTTVDSFEPIEVVCDRDEYINETSNQVTWNYSVSTSCTERSSFSKTEGVTVSTSSGLNVGLPDIVGLSSVSFNTSIQQQSSKSWTYGTNKDMTVTKTRTGSIPVNPYETVKLEATLTMFRGNLTYVATLRKIGDSKTFRVRGKWSGECFSIFRARTYSESGELIGVYELR
ncbi:MAG: hypothetical protein ACI378_00590 [Bacteroides sp.]